MTPHWTLRARASFALAAVGALLAAACSSAPAGGTPCNEAPWQCGAGNTCWPDCVCPSGQSPCDRSNCTVQFGCVSSKAGVMVGENCSLQIGSAQCGDNQTCVSFADGGVGACRSYCDQNQQCGPDDACVALEVDGQGSAVEHVCVPPHLGLDGGLMIGDGGSSGSSGGDAASDAVMMVDATGPAFDGSTGNH